MSIHENPGAEASANPTSEGCKPTPGEWTMGAQWGTDPPKPGDETCIYVRPEREGSRREMIAKVFPVYISVNDGSGIRQRIEGEKEANARLIAAAPDFYSACVHERDTVSRLDWLSALLTEADANFSAWAGDDREAAHAALRESCYLLAALRAAVAKVSGGAK